MSAIFYELDGLKWKLRSLKRRFEPLGRKRLDEYSIFRIIQNVKIISLEVFMVIFYFGTIQNFKMQ